MLWQEPYIVKKKTSEINYRLEVPGTRRHKVFHVSLLKKAPDDAKLAKDDNRLFDKEFKVEAICQQRIRKGK